MLELRAVFEGLARGHAANTCLRHLLLCRCGLQPEALSMVSWRVALMHQVASLDLSRNPALGVVDSSGRRKHNAIPKLIWTQRADCPNTR